MTNKHELILEKTRQGNQWQQDSTLSYKEFEKVETPSQARLVLPLRPLKCCYTSSAELTILPSFTRSRLPLSLTCTSVRVILLTYRSLLRARILLRT